MTGDALPAGAPIEFGLTERPAAKRVYVIYWPGVLEIPWPEGMTALDAVAAWKGQRDDVVEVTRVGAISKDLLAGQIAAGRVLIEYRDADDAPIFARVGPQP